MDNQRCHAAALAELCPEIHKGVLLPLLLSPAPLFLLAIFSLRWRAKKKFKNYGCYGGMLSFAAFPFSCDLCLSSSRPPSSTSKSCLSDLTHLIVQLPQSFMQLFSAPRRCYNSGKLAWAGLSSAFASTGTSTDDSEEVDMRNDIKRFSVAVLAACGLAVSA